MNMSDDVAAATLQMSTKVVEAGSHAFEKTIDVIAKLLQMLGNPYNGNGKVRSTDLTDLKPGKVDIKDLKASARSLGEALSYSENGLTKQDMKYLQNKAKEFKFPIAFTNQKGKDNIYASVRAEDMPLYKAACTEMMKEKLEARSNELSNFKVQEWEMPFITQELNKHDLSAQFGQTKSGEYFCLFDKKDEKAILIARGEFVRKCNEVNKELSFDKDEEGFYTIKELRSGREISFENPPTKKELSSMIQEKFGYSEGKADISCAKFGEEQLQGSEKIKFFSNNPQNEFSKIDSNIELQGESIYAKDYSCWRFTPKTDSVPKLVYQDKDGSFAVLNPEKMTKKQMTVILKEHLNITDNVIAAALVDKAVKVTDYYNHQNEENFSHNYEFSKGDFDMSNPDEVKGMLRTDENGNTFTKELPVSFAENDIQRTEKDSFTVNSNIQIIETDQNGEKHSSHDTQSLKLSFSDKKNAISELTEMYKRQGVPERIAKQMAQDVFSKAEAQSAEKVLQIEEIRTEKQDNSKTDVKVVVSSGNKSEEIEFSDSDKAVKDISEKFDVPETAAAVVLEKAAEQIEEVENEQIDETQEDSMKDESEISESARIYEKENKPDEKFINGHEKHIMDSGDTNQVNLPDMENKPNISSSAGRRHK